MSPLRITARDGVVRFRVRVQPRSSRPGVDGLHGDALRVRVGAAPVEGAANEAVTALLAEALGVARRSVRIVGGASSRTKVVEVDGVSHEAVEALAG
jgi:uncharacterized protein (TIGR00251 family)